jgi:CrcB protein
MPHGESPASAGQPMPSGGPERDTKMNDLATYLIIGIGGFIGANARFIFGRMAVQRWGEQFPMGTFLINVSGSFLLGLFATLAMHFAWDDRWRLLISVGFLGAFTTFSTFEYESLQLATQGAWLRAGGNMLGSVVCGFVAALMGVAMGRLLTRGHV